MYPNIGIIGNGVVGQAIARSYLEHAEVFIHDSRPTRSPHTLKYVLKHAKIIFLCLPTPLHRDPKHGLDISAIRSVCRQLTARPDLVYVLKSTVPIGTTKALRREFWLDNLVHSPEFLTARCAALDACLPSRNIIGTTGDLPAGPVWKDHEIRLLHDLYQQRFPGVPIHIMTSDESEAVKLFQNSFFATKISIFNQLHHLCQRDGLNWDRILPGLLADGRIHPSHTKVPGPDGKYGFGGECLPKDLAQLICEMERPGTMPIDENIFQSVANRNQIDRIWEASA